MANKSRKKKKYNHDFYGGSPAVDEYLHKKLYKQQIHDLKVKLVVAIISCLIAGAIAGFVASRVSYNCC